jgi:hypothetical protein
MKWSKSNKAIYIRNTLSLSTYSLSNALPKLGEGAQKGKCNGGGACSTQGAKHVIKADTKHVNK